MGLERLSADKVKLRHSQHPSLTSRSGHSLVFPQVSKWFSQPILPEYGAQ